MRHPPIHEEVAALKERLPHAHNGHKKPRLQRLSLLASGQAHTRQDVAPLLGVHRHTLGRWLALYAAGGLDVLLATSVPAGKPVSLAPAVLASLAQGLRRPEGFASYAAWRHWVRRTYGVEVQDKTLYMLVRSRFEAKRNVARRSHTKKSRRHRRLSGTLSSLPAAGDPVCRYAPRPRLHPRRKPRQLTDRSPLAPHRPRCAACWAGAAWLRVVLCLWAVALTTGERFFLELSYLNAENCQMVIDLFAEAFPDRLNLLLLDNSGAHTASQLTLPANVRLVFLPASCPELHRIERVWRDLKDALAWLHFAHLDAQQDYVAKLLQAYDPATLQTLTGYTSLVEAIHALYA